MEKYCDVCGEMKKIVVQQEEQDINVKGKIINVTISISSCETCGHEVYNRDVEISNDKIMFNEYKKSSGLLTSEDIKRIRDGYGLSQKRFARILGFGEKTITRYENGSIQDIAHDNLMRLFGKEYNVFSIWELRKSDFTKKENEILDFALNEKPDLSFEYIVTTNPFESYMDFEIIKECDGDKNEC